MNIKDQLVEFVNQLLDTTQTRLSNRELVERIIDIQPAWLPTPIYDPRKLYQVDQRIFHASPVIEQWFIVEGIADYTMNVRFDSGREMTLSHNRPNPIQFPTCIEEYLSLKIENFDLEARFKEIEFKGIHETYGIQCLYHITHIDNLAGILDEGLQCHNQIRGHLDISDPEVQAGRHNKLIPGCPKLTLHDCVPLFFASKTPMLSVRREVQAEIVHLRISYKALFLPGIFFTDGNARSNSTHFYTNLNNLERLDWNILKARYWGSENEALHKENKRRRSAEVLIPGCLSPNYIQSISVLNKSAYNRVIDISKRSGKTMTVTINPDLYFTI